MSLFTLSCSNVRSLLNLHTTYLRCQCALHNCILIDYPHIPLSWVLEALRSSGRLQSRGCPDSSATNSLRTTMSTPIPASTFKLEASEDPLRVFRDEFVIPTNAQMKASAVAPEVGECRSFLRSDAKLG